MAERGAWWTTAPISAGSNRPIERSCFASVVPSASAEGARIIVQGDHSDNVFLALSGLTKVTLDTPDGREIVLSVLGAGDLLGEFEVLEGVPQRTAGNVAVLPVECRVIPGDEFMAALEARPQMLLAMVRVILSRLAAADRRRQASASMGASRSLASFLVELVDRYGTPDGSVDRHQHPPDPGGAGQPDLHVARLCRPWAQHVADQRADRDPPTPDRGGRSRRTTTLRIRDVDGT